VDRKQRIKEIIRSTKTGSSVINEDGIEEIAAAIVAIYDREQLCNGCVYFSAEPGTDFCFCKKAGILLAMHDRSDNFRRPEWCYTNGYRKEGQ
jgi:hypothetical protein